LNFIIKKNYFFYIFKKILIILLKLYFKKEKFNYFYVEGNFFLNLAFGSGLKASALLTNIGSYLSIGLSTKS
jgi:hypothetical protein